MQSGPQQPLQQQQAAFSSGSPSDLQDLMIEDMQLEPDDQTLAHAGSASAEISSQEQEMDLPLEVRVNRKSVPLLRRGNERHVLNRTQDLYAQPAGAHTNQLGGNMPAVRLSAPVQSRDRLPASPQRALWSPFLAGRQLSFGPEQQPSSIPALSNSPCRFSSHSMARHAASTPAAGQTFNPSRRPSAQPTAAHQPQALPAAASPLHDSSMLVHRSEPMAVSGVLSQPGSSSVQGLPSGHQQSAGQKQGMQRKLLQLNMPMQVPQQAAAHVQSRAACERAALSKPQVSPTSLLQAVQQSPTVSRHQVQAPGAADSGVRAVKQHAVQPSPTTADVAAERLSAKMLNVQPPTATALVTSSVLAGAKAPGSCKADSMADPPAGPSCRPEISFQNSQAHSDRNPTTQPFESVFSFL